MRLPACFTFICATLHATAASIPTHQHPLSPPLDSIEPNGFRIPTVRESAVMARRMLHLEGVGTLSTIFPDPQGVSLQEDRPSDVAGLPFGLIEYIADCEPETGNPTILQVDIATSFKNVRGGSNITLSLRWHPPQWTEYSAAKLPRFALMGELEEMEDEAVEKRKVKDCFLRKHKDVIWSPGNDIHESRWVRFVVNEIYWFGGFGDRAYIGWIPKDVWQGVTLEEVHKCRLPGESSSSWRFW